jgi:hypothetical protein
MNKCPVGLFDAVLVFIECQSRITVARAVMCEFIQSNNNVNLFPQACMCAWRLYDGRVNRLSVKFCTLRLEISCVIRVIVGNLLWEEIRRVLCVYVCEEVLRLGCVVIRSLFGVYCNVQFIH